MLPLIIGALGAIAVARELWHPDTVQEKEVAAYREGKQSLEETRDRISQIYGDYYLQFDDSNPRTDELNYLAWVKDQKQFQDTVKNLTPEQKHDLIRDRAVEDFNHRRINQQQLDQAFEVARKIKSGKY